MRESLLVYYFFCVLGIKSKALQILGKSFIALSLRKYMQKTSDKGVVFRIFNEIL